MRIRLARKIAARRARYPRHMVRRAVQRLGRRRFVELLVRAEGQPYTWRRAIMVRLGVGEEVHRG